MLPGCLRHATYRPQLKVAAVPKVVWPTGSHKDNGLIGPQAPTVHVSCQLCHTMEGKETAYRSMGGKSKTSYNFQV